MTIVQRWATTDKEGEPTGLHVVKSYALGGSLDGCLYLSMPLCGGSEHGRGYQHPDAVEEVDPVTPTRGDICVCENPECVSPRFFLTHIDEVSAESGLIVCCPRCRSYDIRRVESSGREPLTPQQ